MLWLMEAVVKQKLTKGVFLLVVNCILYNYVLHVWMSYLMFIVAVLHTCKIYLYCIIRYIKYYKIERCQLVLICYLYASYDNSQLNKHIYNTFYILCLWCICYIYDLSQVWSNTARMFYSRSFRYPPSLIKFIENDLFL